MSTSPTRVARSHSTCIGLRARPGPTPCCASITADWLQHAEQIRLLLEPDPGRVVHPYPAALDANAVRKSAEGLEQVGIGLVSAQPEPRGDIERHLVPAVRDAAAGRPAVPANGVEGAQVFDQSVAQGAVELQPVAIGAHSAITEQVARVLRREEVLAGRQRPLVLARQLRLQVVVERIARFLVPEEAVARERTRVGKGGGQVEAAVRVHRQGRPLAYDLQGGVDAAEVLVEARSADLQLHHRIAAVQVALHLALELRVVLARVVVAARRIDEDRLVHAAVAVALRQEPVERLAGDLRHRVPHRHVQGAHRDRPLSVPARLLVAHRAVPDAPRVEVLGGLVHERARIRLQHARNEALPQERALAVAAVGVEAVADHRPAVAHRVRHHRDRREGHLAEVDHRVPDRRSDRERLLADGDDLHRTASATALPSSWVLAVPPMSRVRGPSTSTVSMARTIASAACLFPRWSSIMAPDQICPIGLAMLRPAMSGAEPCTGSNIEGYSRSGFRFADGALPMVTVTAGPRSERMSPKRFEPTTTSNHCGCSTKCAVRMSMWNLSTFTSLYCAAIASTRSSQYGMVMEMPFDLVAEVRCFFGRERASSKAYRRIRSTPRRVKVLCWTTTSSSVSS